MNLSVKCHCGMVHKIQIGESAKCQCGATLALRKSSKGYITPWASYETPQQKGSSGAPEIINKPRGYEFVKKPKK